MKKSLLAVGLTLAMVLTMATPAFAAISTDPNLNADGTAVTAPGNPAFTQVAGESYNAATMTSTDGAKWETINDDDAVLKATDTAADINVWAKVVDSGSKVYKVDITWGTMKFEFKDSSGQWNPETHAYDKGSDNAKGWTITGFVNGDNNLVSVANHSNNAIDATFAYKMEGTKFNEANGVNNVIGNFFADGAKATAAAKVLTNTYTDTNGTVNETAVADKLPGSKVSLATADAYNDGTADHVASAKGANVYLAFSGTPDAKKGAVLDTFKKVGVITVTVAPNNDINLNRPVVKP